MRMILVLFLTLPMLQVERAEAQVGDPQAGAGMWRAKLCRNCHGDEAEGGFGPDLAGGRGLTPEQFKHAVRQPWGIMAGLNEQQLSDQGVADVYAFLQTQPKVGEPGEWHWRRAPATAALGQQLYMNTVGCGQCHEPENGFGRMWLGEHAKEVDYDYFARQVYSHTEKWPRGSMGNYSREQVPESVLREIYQWMVVDIGMRASVGAAIQMGEREGNRTTFNVTAVNRGLEDVGLDVEGVTLFIKVPSDMEVVSGTGTGYTGVQPLAALGLEPRLPLAPHAHDDTRHVERPTQDLSGNVVVWKIAKIGAGERQALSFVLSGPAPTAQTLGQFAGSTIHWESPGRNANGSPPTMVYRDLRLPDQGDHEAVRPPRMPAQ